MVRPLRPLFGVVCLCQPSVLRVLRVVYWLPPLQAGFTSLPALMAHLSPSDDSLRQGER
jgi:hypothetical protein